MVAHIKLYTHQRGLKLLNEYYIGLLVLKAIAVYVQRTLIYICV